MCGSRLISYSETALEVTKEVLDHISTQESVLDVRENSDPRYNESAFAWEIKVGSIGILRGRLRAPGLS